MRSTIQDVARLAGVSISTVSRVLNGNYPVSDEAKERVMAAVRACNYSPSHVARSLATQKTAIIGVLGTEIINPYFAEMLHYIQAVAAEHHHDVLFRSTETVAGEIKALDLFLERRVDGIILIAHQEGAGNYEHIARASETVPTVLIGMPIDLPTVHSIHLDEAAGANQLAGNLVRKGHTGVLFLGGSDPSFPTSQRLAGLRQAVKAVPGIRVDVALSGYSFDRNAETLHRLIHNEGLLEWCTAIVCVSDYVAMSALAVLHQLGVAVPDTVSVTGFDNVQYSRSVYPPLTTVDAPKEMLARLAVRAILDPPGGSDEHTSTHVVPASVVLRASHGSARLVGPQVQSMGM